MMRLLCLAAFLATAPLKQELPNATAANTVDDGRYLERIGNEDFTRSDIAGPGED